MGGRVEEIFVTGEGSAAMESVAEALNIGWAPHRRNIVTRGVDLLGLRGKRFKVGEVVLEYDRSRPPCKHVQDLSERGMTRALKNRGGICARVIRPGPIRPGDTIEPE